MGKKYTQYRKRWKFYCSIIQELTRQVYILMVILTHTNRIKLTQVSAEPKPYNSQGCMYRPTPIILVS